jgi:hypothetical protein
MYQNRWTIIIVHILVWVVEKSFMLLFLSREGWYLVFQLYVIILNTDVQILISNNVLESYSVLSIHIYWNENSKLPLLIQMENTIVSFTNFHKDQACILYI